MLGSALSLKVAGERFPLFCWGYSTVNTQAEIFPLGRSLQEILEVVPCPGFGWDRVNFLLSSWNSAVFWI